MPSTVPSSGSVNSVIRITGSGDRDRPEWLIRISGIRTILDWFHIAMRLQHTKLAAANLPIDGPDRLSAKAVIVAEIERLHWRIWNGRAKNAQRSIKRIRKVMHAFKAEHSRSAKTAAASKLWH